MKITPINNNRGHYDNIPETTHLLPTLTLCNLSLGWLSPRGHTTHSRPSATGLISSTCTDVCVTLFSLLLCLGLPTSSRSSPIPLSSPPLLLQRAHLSDSLFGVLRDNEESWWRSPEDCLQSLNGRVFFGIAPRLREEEGTGSCSTLLTSCSRDTVVVLDHSLSRFRGSGNQMTSLKASK